jgi:uncharacterized protein YnzC (UPF0291/DUF896 family)
MSVVFPATSSPNKKEEIERIFSSSEFYNKMVEGAKSFAKPEAARMLRNRYRAGLEEGIKDDDKQIEAIDTKAEDLAPRITLGKPLANT